MKGQSHEEHTRILNIAGNPSNAVVEKLNSVPISFRILQRSYFYDNIKKRSGNSKKALGVVIDDEFMSLEEYHKKYTHRGKLRTNFGNKTCNEKTELSGERCVYQKMLGVIPILYETALNCNIVEDLYSA